MKFKLFFVSLIGIFTLGACSSDDDILEPFDFEEPGWEWAAWPQQGPNYFPTDFKGYGTFQECIDACQLPESQLNAMSTNELVYVCMTFPYNLDYIFYNTLIDGLRHSVHLFNGYNVLATREDAYETMLSFYVSKLNEIEKYGDSPEYDINPLLLAYYELFLRFGPVSDAGRMCHDTKLKKALVKAISLRDKYEELQGCMSYSALYELMSVIFLSSGYDEYDSIIYANLPRFHTHHNG